MNKPGLTPTEQNLQLMPWSAPRETLRTAERESPDIRPARMRSAFHQRHIHSHGRWKEHGKSTNCCRLAVRPLPRPVARGEALRKPPQSKSQKFLFSFDGFRLDNQKCRSKCYAPRRILHLSTGNSSCKRSAAERGLALARSAALESARSGHRLQRAPAGFGDLETVVGQMTRGENEQLRAMASFMPAGGMHTASTSATGRGQRCRCYGRLATNHYHECPTPASPPGAARTDHPRHAAAACPMTASTREKSIASSAVASGRSSRHSPQPRPTEQGAGSLSLDTAKSRRASVAGQPNGAAFFTYGDGGGSLRATRGRCRGGPATPAPEPEWSMT